ncbi:MAG: succinylglutamate desuccinylase/aspartoacylase family protein [Verrucomicrobiales bacterium]|jgi:hypothetical protein|nr:succinylglutamate desuccinylase/aspartoacylase family protein [Verrucomicrobiales bacterium]
MSRSRHAHAQSSPAPEIPQDLTRGLKSRRDARELLRPLLELTEKSSRLFHSSLATFEFGNDLYRIDKFSFIGPQRGDYIRLGLFGGIHGDELAGSHAIVEFLRLLHQTPKLATGWEIFSYPVCNPTGFEDNTRFSRKGLDLNREFWHNSKEPEIQILETEINQMNFNGIISLHADDTTDRMYGFARGSQVTRHVLAPSLNAAAKIIPINQDRCIDGFDAEDGIISDCYEGVLGSNPATHPKPFEIVLETPQLLPLKQQIDAHVTALLTLVAEYPKFISYGQDL